MEAPSPWQQVREELREDQAGGAQGTAVPGHEGGGRDPVKGFL